MDTMGEGKADAPNDLEARRSAFLAAMRLVPGAVAIVAASADGRRSGLAATAWNSLSADPPTLLACINRRASAFPMIRQAGAFTINLLPADEAETAAIFSGQRALEGQDRFEAGAWTSGPLGQPLFERALAAFECRLTDAHEHASHCMFLGEVVELRTRGAAAPALLYAAGRFAVLGDSLPTESPSRSS